MGLESTTFISGLVATNPVGASDDVKQGDDHLRLIKAALKNTFPDADHAIYLDRPQADVASSATTSIGAATTNFVRITGTTAITAFDTTAAGIWRYLRFADALTLTHNATSLILPGGANITTAVGDTALAVSLGSGNWIVLFYVKANGKAVIAPDFTDLSGTIALAQVPDTLLTFAKLATAAIASQIEAEAGTATDKLMTPQRTAQAIVAQAFDILHVQDQKASGTDGGSLSGGSWVTRTLNTVVTNTITGASLATNQITLPAGTYDIWARAPAWRVGGHKAKFYNITDAADSLIGSSARSGDTDGAVSDSIVIGRVTIAAAKVFELQQRSSSAQPSTGLGEPTSFVSTIEVYAEVRITKVA